MPNDLATLGLATLSNAWRLRWKRRRLLWRALRKRRQLQPLADRTKAITKGDILAAVTVRNEIQRLPHFLAHYRRLGVRHFLIVDNGSNDGTTEFLLQQADVSLWSSAQSYRRSRFGLDWLTWLLMRHGHGHWCLTLDADELLIYPYWQSRDLRALTDWLQSQGRDCFGAMMLDLYPKGRLLAQNPDASNNPLAALQWFDAGNLTMQRQPRMGNLWIQGGPRSRLFFGTEPRRGPTLTKVPLVRWNRRYAYVNSTHAILPPRLNRIYDTRGGELTSGLLLHTKFLPLAVDKAREEKQRGEHFANSSLYDDYYDRLSQSPDLWSPASTRLGSWRQLEALGLISRGGWI